ncbi:LeuA family protein [Halomarina litorea]|uniref:LeuA family protein n=1 Tax=Halomarina litorea TaxID=2961595 RepID=UPI0020C356C9|nr:citramalate synthase [Halomarina sp. BCD28]
MRLCDVTLREASQMPGREYTVDQRLVAGRALDRLDLPLVEAGFPATGDHDARVVSTLAGELDADVVAIARAREDDVAAAIEAGADVVNVFVPVSERQLEHMVGMTREEAFAATAEALDRAAEGGTRAHLTLTDAFRAEPSAVGEAFDRFDASIALADTVGARTPSFVAGYLRTLAEEGADVTRMGVHFHDDLGCATANALVAASLGVDRIDVSVASLGERAGNPALEEVVVAARQEGTETGLVERELVPVCREVLDALDESVDPRKAVIGEAVASHESGLHTAAMLSDPATFEAFDPTEFGGERRLLFGAQTGRESVRRLLERAGREPTDERVTTLLDELEREGPLGLDEATTLAGRVD